MVFLVSQFDVSHGSHGHIARKGRNEIAKPRQPMSLRRLWWCDGICWQIMYNTI